MNKESMSKPLYKYANQRKGYDYESEIWDILDLSGIDYECNPIIFESNNPKVVEWINPHNQLEGYDILIPIVGYPTSLRVECKFVSKPIYHSWFVRDWLSRDCHIIVTNNKWNVPYEDRQLLKQRGIMLLDTVELYNYLFQLFNASSNQYILEYYKYKSKSDKKTKINSSKRQKDYRIRLRLFLNLIKTTVWLMDGLNVKGDLREIQNDYPLAGNLSRDNNSKRGNKRISESTNNRVSESSTIQNKISESLATLLLFLTNLFTRCKTNLMIGKFNVGRLAFHREILSVGVLAPHNDRTNREIVFASISNQLVKEIVSVPSTEHTNREIVRVSLAIQTVRDKINCPFVGTTNKGLSFSNLLNKLKGILNKNRDKEITNAKVRLSYSLTNSLFSLFTNSLFLISAITRIIKDSKDKRINNLKERLRYSARNNVFQLFTNSLLSISDKTILINKYKEGYKK